MLGGHATNAANHSGDGLARTGEPRWDIRVDGTSIGEVHARLNETQETVRQAAAQLVDERRR